MAVDKSYANDSPIPIPKMTEQPSVVPRVGEQRDEPYVRQLEILCETNKRLGESNDELRDALGLLSGHIRHDQEMRCSSGMEREGRCNSGVEHEGRCYNGMEREVRCNNGALGCHSAPITPIRRQSDCDRPQSTSTAPPRRVLLTKYHTTSALPGTFGRRHSEVDDDDIEDEELVRLIDQTNDDDDDDTNDGPIYIEEKLLHESIPPDVPVVAPIGTRGSAVGADSSPATNSLQDRTTPDRMYKLVLAGNAAVGKSSFIIRLCRDKFYSALNSTLGVDFQMKSVDCDGQHVSLFFFIIRLIFNSF